MKNLKLIATLVVTSLFIWACCDCETETKEPENKVSIPPGLITKIKESPLCIQDSKSDQNNTKSCIVRDEIIVMYSDDVYQNETYKQKLRNLNGVDTNYEKCSCGDERLERWRYNLNDDEMINVEKLITELPDETGEKGLKGDNELVIALPRGEEFSSFQPQDIQINTKFINTDDNKGVNIAIIDTGIDYGYIDFSQKNGPKLYNSSSSNCGTSSISSGWNFITKNNNVTEYSTGNGVGQGHGTYVTKTIIDQLQNSKTTVNILPIKAFDSDGKSSYWNILCSMNYINSFDDIHIVNTSFGFKKYNPSLNTSILEELIQNLKGKSLIIASAGNENKDTDKINNEHYPSGFKLNNIIGVGGYQGTPVIDGDIVNGVDLYSSNYGKESIDIVAPYDLQLKFPNIPADVNLQGTSFSAPFIGGKLLNFYLENFSNYDPIKIRNAYLNSIELKAPKLDGKIAKSRIEIEETP